MKKRVLASLTIGSAMALSAAGISAGENPFSAENLPAGYQLAGADKDMEGKCGEGKCGEDMKKEKPKKDMEGKCGEGKCGEDMKKEKPKKDMEGKCGEGKCGGSA